MTVDERVLVALVVVMTGIALLVNILWYRFAIRLNNSWYDSSQKTIDRWRESSEEWRRIVEESYEKGRADAIRALMEES